MWVIYGDPFPGGGDACEITGVASLGPPSWPLGSSWPFLAPRAWRSQEEPEGARRGQEEGPIGALGDQRATGGFQLGGMFRALGIPSASCQDANEHISKVTALVQLPSGWHS